jgi:hypothetical protein
MRPEKGSHKARCKRTLVTTSKWIDKCELSLGVVTYTCNTICLVGRECEDHGSRPAPAKS